MIILASGSPRRRELMAFAADEFTVIPSGADEIIPDGTAPDDVPVYLAELKAADVAAAHPDDIVIGCDTVVICDGEIMGKPKDEQDAARMLGKLSGSVHSVVTGVCIIGGGRKKSFGCSTEVEFYPLSDKDISAYIATGDPMDKAGAYGIQSEGCVLVKGIKGDFFNVVGMPVARLKRELAEFM